MEESEEFEKLERELGIEDYDSFYDDLEKVREDIRQFPKESEEFMKEMLSIIEEKTNDPTEDEVSKELAEMGEMGEEKLEEEDRVIAEIEQEIKQEKERRINMTEEDWQKEKLSMDLEVKNGTLSEDDKEVWENDKKEVDEERKKLQKNGPIIDEELAKFLEDLDKPVVEPPKKNPFSQVKGGATTDPTEIEKNSGYLATFKARQQAENKAKGGAVTGPTKIGEKATFKDRERERTNRKLKEGSGKGFF
ncbi:MAG: hypothetical protein LBI29_01015 [Rickettsiales bacterium]|nr:hypothetical protein [Rickettsiales bacterium]